MSKIKCYWIIVTLSALIVLLTPTRVGTTIMAAADVRNTPQSSEFGIRITEIMFQPTAGAYEWVELQNLGSTAVSLTGFSLTDEDGHWYRFPASLPAVPVGAFVVVLLDGANTPDDDDFSDNVAVLHSTLSDIFEDAADQCALYAQSYFIYLPLILKNTGGTAIAAPTPFTTLLTSPVRDFVAWGASPQEDGRNAARAGVWPEGRFISLYRGVGEAAAEVAAQPGESIGLLPETPVDHPDHWQLYQANESTMGAHNVWPVISWFYPPAGAAVDSGTFAISWNGINNATGYRFQLDDTMDFSSPITDTVLSSPSYVPTAVTPEGTYYWRVRAIFAEGESAWSMGQEIRSLARPSMARAAALYPTASRVLGLTWQLQHKDTHMLCLDGDDEIGDFAWDAPQIDMGVHGSNYCVRASVSMIASYYGGTLSQDRISYEIFADDVLPERDLGHDTSVQRDRAIAALSWALGINAPVHDGKPDFAEIQAWIDAGQPLRAVIPGHSRVIDGYDIGLFGGEVRRFIHLLDPANGARWVNYADDPIVYVQIGPAGINGAPDVLSDEDDDNDGIADTVDDSDGDEVCDFDENYRFHLDPLDIDTDDDLVPDKLDIREYVFDAAGQYQWRNPDIDSDWQRKEVDPDNDSFWNVTAWDGYEDVNRNGRFEPGLNETDNFNVRDDRVPKVDITAPVFGQDYGYQCLITVEGTIRSDTVLTSTILRVQGGADYTLIPVGATPVYTFRQTEVALPSTTVIMVIATNQYGFGRDYVQVYANCYK
ncbi:MAG: lamin tail domain-containing protein [Anaerolineae bacterium]